VYEFDRLSLREAPRVICIGTNGYDLHSDGSVMRQQAIHLAYDIHGDLPAAPLLALHKRNGTSFPEHKIYSTIGTALSGFLHAITLPAESLSNEDFELPPAQGAKAIKTGLGIEQLPALTLLDAGEQGP